MTTDRTAAPTRGTALADRAAVAGRKQAPPADMFSALLGAATPKSGDAPARRDDAGSRRDDAFRRRDDRPRAEHPRRAEHPMPLRDDAPRPAAEPVEAKPAAVAPEPTKAAVTDAAPAETPAAPAIPDIFALALASPLRPQAAPATETPVTAPPLPAFTGAVPVAVASATTAPATVTGAGTGVAEAATAPATEPPPAVVAPTQGAIALPGLPAEATADSTLPAGLELTKPQPQPQPQPQTAAPAAEGAAAGDAQPVSSGASEQGSADAQTQDHHSTPAPAAPAAPAAQATKPFDAPAPVATQPAATTPIAPATAPAMPSMPSVERAVPLSRAVATTGVLIHMAAERGIHHARLNLKPVELGGIEVRLRSTAEGVHAQLVADSPEAARMLSAAGEDLRKGLEEKNVTLLSLDVSTSGDKRDQPAAFGADGFGENYRPGGSNMSRSSGKGDDGLMDTPALAETVLVLPDGVHVHVDVFA